MDTITFIEGYQTALSALMERNHISEKELAAECGIPYQTVRNYMKAAAPMPSAYNALKMLAASGDMNAKALMQRIERMGRMV